MKHNNAHEIESNTRDTQKQLDKQTMPGAGGIVCSVERGLTDGEQQDVPLMTTQT